MLEDRHDGGRVGGSHTLEYVGMGRTVQLFSQRVPRDGTVGDFTVDRGLPTLQNGRSEWWIDRLGGDEVVDANRTSVSKTHKSARPPGPLGGGGRTELGGRPFGIAVPVMAGIAALTSWSRVRQG